MKKISFKNKEEFKQFVINEATKIIKRDKQGIKKVVKESVKKKEENVSPQNVAELANKMKELNKNLRFSNPVISEVSSRKIQRDEDMAKYNRQKNVAFKNESEKDKWNRMMGYEIPSDDKR